MSRHILAPLNPNHEVVIGFDRAGGSSGATFFGQVFNIEIQVKIENGDYADEEELEELEETANILIVGDDYSQPVTSFDIIERAIAQYAAIPPDIKQLLIDEQQAGTEILPCVFKDYVQSQIEQESLLK